MLIPDDAYIEKITNFIKTEQDKSEFRTSMILSFREEFVKLDKVDKCGFFDYLTSIRENMFTIEEVYICCRDELIDLMTHPVGCMKHLLLSERKNMLNQLIDETSVCEDILYNCIAEMI